MRRRRTTITAKPTTTSPAMEHIDPGGRERETVIMFVDIMGASEVSNHKSPKDYATFVNKFQKLFMDVCKRYTDAWYEPGEREQLQFSARGDEGLLMIYRPETLTDPTVDIDVAINIALELKRKWLCSEINAKERIDSGLLPIDLAIGIHIGRTYLERMPASKPKPEGNPGGWLPEGYAINLAKRVESHSRQGRFSHILLSEAAEGQLNYLTNERTYLFDNPQVVSPKGISRDIRVYEIKHHFLPSDWTEESEQSRRSKTLLDPTSVNIEVVKKALAMNPTNLWLSEEFIRSSMLQNYNNLLDEERDDPVKRSIAFKEARDKATFLSQGDQRDAGVLFIQGLVEGECSNYEGERRLYDDAIYYREQLAEAYWYKGQSFSMQIYDELEGDSKKPLSKLPAKLQALVPQAISNLRQAKSMRSQAAWMLFDYACEVIRWAEDDQAPEIPEAINDIVAACHALDEVKEKLNKEPYLERVHSHPTIKKLLADEHRPDSSDVQSEMGQQIQ